MKKYYHDSDYFDRVPVEKQRVCCNCRRCERVTDKNGHTTLRCLYDGSYICYLECFAGWCKHWAKERSE